MAKADAPVLLWFREDLRLTDQRAVAAAAETGRPVIPLYVLNEAPERRPLGGASRWWLDKSLRAHAARLAEVGSRLVLRRGPAVETVLALAEELGAATVCWCRSVEPVLRDQDEALAAALAERGVEARAELGNHLLDPLALRTGAGGPFRVYGAFRKALLAKAGEPTVTPAPNRLAAPKRWLDSDDLDSWMLHPTRPDWSTGFDWTPGETAAAAKLDRFLAKGLANYGGSRDQPHVEGTTRLSPHLRFGEISPRQVLCAASAAAHAHPELEPQREKLAFEVAWREFSYHLLAHNPALADQPLRPAFAHFPYAEDTTALAAWRRGRTGYPIVDAGMNQLWVTGWMHNRVRLIAASFLVKHLLVDWREGERWFWDTLVDADPANNPASWQWIAGSGVDASPYFRIFNPVAQGERFDPDGDYVRRWVPALAKLPSKFVHQPWTAPTDVLAKAGVRLGETYPGPIVEHGAARARALEAFRTLRGDAG